MIKKFDHVKPAFLDAFEKYALCAVFVLFSYRMILGYYETGSPITLIYLADQLIVLLFILFRRSTEAISTRAGDWFVGLSGTFVALLFGPTSGAPLVPLMVTSGFLLCGLLLHLSAKLTLRRSFGVVAANRGIKASGPYQLVRHPMYTGYMLSQAGLLLAGPTLNNAVVICVCWGLFLWRIEAEERILRTDISYAALARYKLIPKLY